LPTSVDRKTENVIIVINHELLSIVLLVHDNTNSCSVKDEFSSFCISQVISGVATSIAINVIKFKLCIRLFFLFA